MEPPAPVAGGSGPQQRDRTYLTVSVVICAYTEDRWTLLQRAVASVRDQDRMPMEIIVSIDHNESLLERCRQEWVAEGDSPSPPVEVIANKYEGRLGSARNSAGRSRGATSWRSWTTTPGPTGIGWTASSRPTTIRR